jgi:hypothetical protein
MVASQLPILSEPNGNLAVAPYLAVWLTLGGIAGALAPERPWRWAIAMALGNPIVGIIRQGVSSDGLWFQIVTLPLLLVAAAPIAIGAYAGRRLSGNRGVATMPSSGPDGHPAVGLQVRQFLVCALGCAVASLVLPNSWRLAGWSAVAGVTSALFSSRFRVRPFRSSALSVGGAVAGFVVSVALDTVTGRASHNLLPFELWFVIVGAFVCSILAAWLGAVITKTRERRVA